MRKYRILVGKLERKMLFEKSMRVREVHVKIYVKEVELEYGLIFVAQTSVQWLRSCERCVESSASVKGVNYFDQLRYYQLLNYDRRSMVLVLQE